MNVLPLENLFDVYLNLNPNDIFNTSKVLSGSRQTQEQAKILGTREFWDWYIRNKYFIHTYDKTWDPIDIAVTAENFLNTLYKNELYLPTYALEPIFKYTTSGTDLSTMINLPRPQLFVSSISLIADLIEDRAYTEYMSDLAKLLNINIRLPEIPNTPELQRFRTRDLAIHEVFSEDEKKFYRAVMSYITTSTYYFTPRGITRFNFNSDMKYFVSNEIDDHLLRFYEYIEESSFILERDLVLRSIL